MIVIFGEETVRVICAYGSLGGRTMAEKQGFNDELASEWNLRSNAEMVLNLEDFTGHCRKRIDGFEGKHEGNSFGERNVEKEMSLEFRDEKELCVANTWFKKK